MSGRRARRRNATAVRDTETVVTTPNGRMLSAPATPTSGAVTAPKPKRTASVEDRGASGLRQPRGREPADSASQLLATHARTVRKRPAPSVDHGVRRGYGRGSRHVKDVGKVWARQDPVPKSIALDRSVPARSSRSFHGQKARRREIPDQAVPTSEEERDGTKRNGPDRDRLRRTSIRPKMAVTVGFEPTVGGYPTQLFESCTFGRSDTSPPKSLRHVDGCRESAAAAAVSHASSPSHPGSARPHARARGSRRRRHTSR